MKRGLYRANAVILNSFDYSESDRILAFYTLEYGKLKGIAKGARRSKKRFVNNLEPLSLVSFGFFHSGSELVRVEDSRLLDGFASLKGEIERLSEACYLLELVSELTREAQVLPNVYHLLADYLKAFDNGAQVGMLTRSFEIKLLSMVGYSPHLGGCVVCRELFSAHSEGESGNNGGMKKFSSEKGGCVCQSCSRGLNGLVDVSAGTVRFLNAALKFAPDNLSRIKAADSLVAEGGRILYDFIKFQLGKELKTKRFMEKMR